LRRLSKNFYKSRPPSLPPR